MKNPKFALSCCLIVGLYIGASLRWVDIGSPRQWGGLLLFAAVIVWRLFRCSKAGACGADETKEARAEAAERLLGRGRIFWEWLGIALTAAGVAWGAMDLLGVRENSHGFTVGSLLAFGGMLYSLVIDVLIDDEINKGTKNDEDLQ